ncbi:MAG: glutathione peroxidase [Cryobacterium sp.]|nr:glutathione peroxidase [Oligoflexia bacterium]
MSSSPIHNIPVQMIDGKETTLASYEGKVLLIVNVASKCGFTSQYEGLEKLYLKYRERGFEVLGFPCNQFMAQEPGNAEEIKNFCSLTYSVDFPLFQKVDVNGPSTHPLYQLLKREAKGLFRTESVKWNFTKFLVDRNGKVLSRFSPKTLPESLGPQIERALGESTFRGNGK